MGGESGLGGRDALLGRVDRLPRVPFAALPTPLEEMPRLRTALGPDAPRLLVKRDDLTGLAFGGNKVRHLEFRLADALAKGADTLFVSNRAQSNHVRLHAALAARFGLQMAVLLVPDGRETRLAGNLLLDHLLGARIVVARSTGAADVELEREAFLAQLRAEGRRVYDVSRDAFSRLSGTIGYLPAAIELLDQLAALGLRPAHIFMAAGNSTAGLALAGKVLGAPYRVHPVSVGADRAATEARVCGLANEVAAHLDLAERLSADDISVHDEYVGDGPDTPPPAAHEALLLAARREGLPLEPIYTARAMAALIDHVRHGRSRADEVVIFVHSGGLPALFAYGDEISGRAGWA
jgi:1-aminocyclopropane-1-carboxylate deaminase/D-cysteine desulfhydrase-like pyridoxal-dependent ACC family enzyme